MSRSTLSKLTLEELYKLEDNLRNLRGEYDSESREEIEELIFDVRMVINSK